MMMMMMMTMIMSQQLIPRYIHNVELYVYKIGSAENSLTVIIRQKVENQIKNIKHKIERSEKRCKNHYAVLSAYGSHSEQQ